MSLKHTISLILLFMMIGCAKTSKSETIAIYKDLEGNAVALSNFKGKKVLLNFWATWCLPCLEEMPSMAKAQQLLASENYVFLFATTDKIDKINKFKEKHPYPFQYLQYQGSLDKLNIHALPVTFIYNTEGELVRRIDGVKEWGAKEMLNQLKAVQ
ncbi:TlpA disulfide reductase family protein [Aureibaculum sp. 2210JD6-5]|uniref:TlpA disulfide reductase family protein n=1 Tax=Aureibaculum sp. 2210JD6-5 TaxID=3103957 RepID=UPI002AAEEBAC|nr:TlpA disulfide reductase family protein [Aureibaculum sp. 2210JD6-5]MDY7394157.1 TlpA disulfide reductase family protein [Aureibaculum sp. 2210JD6-5]